LVLHGKVLVAAGFRAGLCEKRPRAAPCHETNQLMKNCIPWEGSHTGAEEQCGEERAAERTDCNPLHSPFLCTAQGGERVDGSWMKE